MTALTKGRRALSREGKTVSDPVAANAKIFTGALVVLVGGFLKPGTVATGLKARGIAAADADNTGGADGAIRVDVERKGAFPFVNHGADPIDRTHIGGNAYIVDDQTVAATDGTGARSVAGKIIDLDVNGVWIEFP